MSQNTIPIVVISVEGGELPEVLLEDPNTANEVTFVAVSPDDDGDRIILTPHVLDRSLAAGIREQFNLVNMR